MMDLNNPGNIKHGPSKWKGMSKSQPHGTFVKFDTREDGMAAQARLILNYQKLHNLHTVEQIIKRYAPTTVGQDENPHQQEYINFVAKGIGKRSNDYLDLDDYELMRKFVVAQALFENGAAYKKNPYSDEEIRKALLMARIHNVPPEKKPAEKTGAAVAGTGIGIEAAVRIGGAISDTLEKMPWIGDTVKTVSEYSPLFTIVAFSLVLVGGGIALYTFHRRQQKGQV